MLLGNAHVKKPARIIRRELRQPRAARHGRRHRNHARILRRHVHQLFARGLRGALLAALAPLHAVFHAERRNAVKFLRLALRQIVAVSLFRNHADHPMAWHDDGNRVSPDRAADSPRARAVAQQRAVCRRLSVWDFKQARPYAQPERRADQVQRRGEIRLSARKVVVQPARRLVKNRRALFLARLRQIRREMPCAVKPEPDQPLLVGGEQKATEGRGVTLHENHR